MPTALAPTRRMALHIIRKLPAKQLHAATEFLKFLETAEEWEATREIMSDRALIRRVRASRKAWAEGRRDEFIPWEEVRVQKLRAR